MAFALYRTKDSFGALEMLKNFLFRLNQLLSVKLLLNIPKQYKKQLNFVLSGLICLSIIIANSHVVNSQNTTTPEPADLITAESLDTAELAQTIKKVEAKWERAYEKYFRRNFVNYNRSADKIAQHLKNISQQTSVNPAVIWAIPKPKFLQLLLVTPNNRLVMEKIRSADAIALDSIVTQFNIAIADRHSRKYLPPAKQLYKWIFAPFESYLEAENIDTILLCTGPKLRSLPFAALHDGEKFAIEKYNLALIPAFNLSDTNYEANDEGQENKQVLAMGASEFKEHPALPGVAVELHIITPQLWAGRKIMNQDFTLENLQSAHQQGEYDIIHLATHSEFRSGSPDNSYIQFSDRPLGLDQFASLNLGNPPVDLLVLSSCETALGDKDAELGFAGLAIQTGAKSVLASLWPINDAGTVALMSEFYQDLKQTPIKAEALKQAQLTMLEGKVSFVAGQLRGSEVSVPLPPALTNLNIEQQELAHPFYWAGFTMIGNPW